MTYFVIDIESDGPVVPMYSMVSFGAVILDTKLDQKFYGRVKPISDKWLPKALAVCKHTREETLLFPAPEVVMPEFALWVAAHTQKGTRPVFVSDNNGYDFSFMNYYLWRYVGKNIFGHSSRNMNDLYKGMQKNMKGSFKRLVKTKHTHHPVDDAMGNAEALLAMREMGLKLVL